ncbi:hypothetical protein Pint_12289 [Pistacia integerrima]|uniref:Uncharacterized protein n=1 Tax=Pistacia integerrima TaxID=434235 RepID=A0ACC0XMI5_9ROSI|nr:hypothetical protein Pint_12289 [Pistacia integerrima]
MARVLSFGAKSGEEAKVGDEEEEEEDEEEKREKIEKETQIIDSSLVWWQEIVAGMKFVSDKVVEMEKNPENGLNRSCAAAWSLLEFIGKVVPPRHQLDPAAAWFAGGSL